MAEFIGKIIICDRCGKEARLKKLEEKARDGGFTRYDIFEPSPEGWETVADGYLLCDRCNKNYKSMIEGFMKGKKNE